MIHALLPAALSLAALAQPTPVPPVGPAGLIGETVALKAGTIYLVEGGKVIEGGGTILVRDGVIAEVGADLAVPPGTRVIDYGPGASIAPGLVAANSVIGPGRASERTADPSVRALDNFDPYSTTWAYDLAGGITTVYLAPARGRLIAGQGAVVKLAGDGERVLADAASLHGSVSADARSVGGYWEPPVPATVDVGLGVEQRQLPKSTMGAVLALREILHEARNGLDSGEYGPGTPAQIAEHLRAGTPWRLRAETEAELGALLSLVDSERINLVIEGAGEAAGMADAIKASGASVVVTTDVAPGKPGRDFGRGRDARWPSYSAASALANAGVPLAIATPNNLRARDLRFAAAVASRGGLSEAHALRAITLGAAEVLGVADRVGSIKAGKDADFAVFSGEPMSISSSLMATWVGGSVAFTPPAPSSSKGSKASGAHAAAMPAAVVIEAEELHLGDGDVMRPGQVLIVDGKVAEVGERVGRPFGAALVRGAVAMPGLVDALGHLGLEGSGKTPDPDFKLSRLVEPGDFADRRVALSGVTTVVMSPRAGSRSGAPMLAYKPASSDVERMIVEDPAALRLVWSDPRNRNRSGADVKKLLDKVVEYDKKWKAYDKAIAEWVPPAEEPKKDDEDEDEDDDKKDEESDDDAKASKKKKKKKDEDDEEQGDLVTGVWDAELALDDGDPTSFRLRIGHADGKVAGTLRCAALSSTLITVSGTFEQDGKGGELDLTGLGSEGFVQVTGEVKKGELEGTVALQGVEHELEAERTSEEYVVAGRSELRKPKEEEEAKAPKGKPKSPGIDDKLEPLRAALRGEKALVVSVDVDFEILECVDAFEQAGIKPVLYGAPDAWRVIDEIRGRVAGVLLSQGVVRSEPGSGLAGWRNTYQELAGSGIPVAFHSAAEEGASELWLQAAYAVSQGLSPSVAVRALTSDSAAIMGIADRVGSLAPGMDGDVLLLDGPPLDPATSVLRVWVAGEEIQ